MPRPARSPTSRLQAGEQLVGSGPVAAGDTVRWIIGDTESGAGAAKQDPYPGQADARRTCMTNLVINTDRRTYHLELRSTEKTYMASVSWQYPQDQLIALRRQNAAAEAAAPVDSRRRSSRDSISAMRSRATAAPWRPLRAFDDGRKVYIEFPRGIAPGRDAAALRHRRRRRQPSSSITACAAIYMIVDRLFAAAELRLGGEQQQDACASCAPTGGRRI